MCRLDVNTGRRRCDLIRDRPILISHFEQLMTAIEAGAWAGYLREYTLEHTSFPLPGFPPAPLAWYCCLCPPIQHALELCVEDRRPLRLNLSFTVASLYQIRDGLVACMAVLPSRSDDVIREDCRKREGRVVPYLGGEPFPPAGKGKGGAASSGRGAFPAWSLRQEDRGLRGPLDVPR